MCKTPHRLAAACCTLLVVGIVAPQPELAAQASPSPEVGQFQHTRPELERLLAQLEQAAGAPGYSSALRERAHAEARLVRARLAEGDFQVGDQITIYVPGEEQLSSTFLVKPGRILTLPDIGDISLEGVLRSELNSHLTQELSRYLHTPVVESRSLVRLWIDGEVRQPGFYGIPPEALLSDALMQAGGLLSTAKLSGVRVERNNERIWEGELVQSAVTEGRTVDQMSLRAGDRIFVPAQEPGTLSKLRSVSVVSGLVLAIVSIVQIF